MSYLKAQDVQNGPYVMKLSWSQYLNHSRYVLKLYNYYQKTEMSTNRYLLKI